jgi:hypothetical protein
MLSPTMACRLYSTLASIAYRRTIHNNHNGKIKCGLFRWCNVTSLTHASYCINASNPLKNYLTELSQHVRCFRLYRLAWLRFSLRKENCRKSPKRLLIAIILTKLLPDSNPKLCASRPDTTLGRGYSSFRPLYKRSYTKTEIRKDLGLNFSKPKLILI